MNTFKETFKNMVDFFKNYGYDFYVVNKINSRMIEDAYKAYVSPVLHSNTMKCVDDRRRNLLKYICLADKEEKRALNSESKCAYEDKYGYDYENIVRRNDIYYTSILKTISEVNVFFEKKIDEEYADLEDIFVEKLGRAPKLLKEVQRAGALANADSHEIVDSFDMKKINALKKKHISIMNVFMFAFKAPFFNKDDINKMTKSNILTISRLNSDPEIRNFYKYCYDMEGVKGVNKAIEEIEDYYLYSVPYFFKNVESLFRDLKVPVKEAIDIVAESGHVVEKIIKNEELINIIKSGRVSLIEAIELTKCEYDLEYLFTKHDLKDCPVKLNNNETISIMKWNDPKQIMLGIYTSCCQRFEEAGESSMLYGLLSEHSGFLKIERNNKILGQAWVWEADPDTLVLDNIELANCRDINQFRELLYIWVKKSPYKNIQLGLGYSDMDLGTPMSAEEIEQYDLLKSRSYTEKVKDFFWNKDIYTDADRDRNWLKKDNSMMFSYEEE